MPEYQGKAYPGPMLLMVGTWNNSHTYRPGFVVVKDGTAYVALKTHKNITPGSDATAWTGISTGVQGDPGDPGTPASLADLGTMLSDAGITASSTISQLLAAFGIV
jgi:hypothetical protein